MSRRDRRAQAALDRRNIARASTAKPTSLSYADLSWTMRMFLGYWQAFRLLGFAPQQIYCAVLPSQDFGGVNAAHALLKVGDPKTGMTTHAVALDSLPTQARVDALTKEYVRVAEAMATKTIPQADLDRVYAEQDSLELSKALAGELESKGFPLPQDTR